MIDTLLWSLLLLLATPASGRNVHESEQRRLATCYLSAGLVIGTPEVIGWEGHHEYSVQLTLQNWVPDAVLTITFPPPNRLPMNIRKVYYGNMLYQPQGLASGG